MECIRLHRQVRHTLSFLDVLQDVEIEINDAGNAELAIDWGDDPPVEALENDDVARGKDALTVLDNPTTRFQFMDELAEVCSQPV